MAEPILADTRHTTTRETIRQAIIQRTTRGMLTYNTGRVHHLEGELWAVPSTRGGFHQVDLEAESCNCEDFTFYGSAAGIPCRHVYAAAIARARDGRRGCSGCYDGWVFLGDEGEDENGELVEVDTERVPCRRCNPKGL